MSSSQMSHFEHAWAMICHLTSTEKWGRGVWIVKDFCRIGMSAPDRACIPIWQKLLHHSRSWQYTFKTLCDPNGFRWFTKDSRTWPSRIMSMTSVRECKGMVRCSDIHRYRRKVSVLWNMASKDLFFTELYAGFPTFSFQGKQPINGWFSRPIWIFHCYIMPKNSLYSMFLAHFWWILMQNHNDVIFKTIKSGGVTSRRCDVMPCGITTLWRDVITTDVGGNPQSNHNSTKVILDGSNAGMIHHNLGSMGSWSSFHSGGGSDIGDCWMVTWYDLRLRTVQSGLRVFLKKN
jgi:hypothetical protein